MSENNPKPIMPETRSELMIKFRSYCEIEALNNKKIILIVFGIIFFLGVYLRLYNLTEVYTEYDDIGVLALHKGVADSREAEGDFWVFKKTFSFEKETLRNLDQSFLFPLYIAWGWTYSPGQYVVYPLMLSNDDDYDTKVFKGRFISALASIATIFLLFWLFVKLNKGLNWAVLFPVALFTFSQNSILYAHHMSPYSTYGFSVTVGLILIYLVSEKSISTYTGCLINSILLYFSYLNILLFVPLLYIEYDRGNLKAFILSYFSNKKFLFLCNILLLFPVLVVLKMKTIRYDGNPGSLLSFNGMRGVGIPQVSDFMSLISTPFYALKQLFVASKSVLVGFIPFSASMIFVLLFLATFIFTLCAGVFKIPVTNRIFFWGTVLFLFQWVILYLFSKLPLDQTRHVLIFFPVILALCFVCFNYFKLPNLFYLILLLVALPYSYTDAKNMVEGKTSNLDFKYINKQNIDHIFLFSSTLSPMLYFEGKKTVHNVDMNSFIMAYQNLELPDKFLLVSQAETLESYTPILKIRFPELFSEYAHETLIENTTEQYFTYNNHKSNSTQNGFYIYSFSRFTPARLGVGKKNNGHNDF